MRNLLFLSIITVFVSGCATTVKLPTTTNQTPEVSGETGKGHIGLNLSPTVSVTTIEDVTTNPPTRTKITVNEVSGDLFDFLFGGFAGTSFDVGFGLLSRLELYYTPTIGLRFQWLGDPKGNGWKSTLFAGGFDSTQTQSASANSIDTQTRSRPYGTEYGLSLGYRKDSKLLVYVTFASRGGKASIQVENSTTSNTYSYEDNYDQYMGHIGVQGGEDIYFRIEAGATSVNWRAMSSATSQEISDSGVQSSYTLGAGMKW